MLIRKSILMMAVVLSPMFAFAEEGGNSGGGGGDAVKTAQGWKLLDLAEPSLTARFFSFEETQVVDELYANRLNKCGARVDIPHVHKYFSMSFGKVISESQDLLVQEIFGPKLSWTSVDGDLGDLRDEGALRLVDLASKKQVALQKNGIVIVSKPIFDQLDRKSKGALYLHERLVQIVTAQFPENYKKYGTSEIRQLVNLILSDNYYQVPESALQRFCGANGTVLKTLTYTRSK